VATDHGKNRVRIQLTRLIRRDPTSAPQNPLTLNPGTTADTSQSIKALMTRRKRPRVRRVRGRVKKTRMGLMTALTRASKNAAAKAERNPLTEINPGKR